MNFQYCHFCYLLSFSLYIAQQLRSTLYSRRIHDHTDTNPYSLLCFSNKTKTSDTLLLSTISSPSTIFNSFILFLFLCSDCTHELQKCLSCACQARPGLISLVSSNLTSSSSVPSFFPTLLISHSLSSSHHTSLNSFPFSSLSSLPHLSSSLPF